MTRDSTTTSQASRTRSHSQNSHRDGDDVLAKAVIEVMTHAVSELTSVAQAYASQAPPGAAHVHRLSEELAGVTVDALRSWPDAAG